MKILFLIVLSTLSIQGFSKVRTVEVAKDQIVKVRLLLGSQQLFKSQIGQVALWLEIQHHLKLNILIRL